MKICLRCDHFVSKGNKYCEFCTRDVKREMRESGYLTKVPKRKRERPEDAQEDINETKYGVDE